MGKVVEVIAEVDVEVAAAQEGVERRVEEEEAQKVGRKPLLYVLPSPFRGHAVSNTLRNRTVMPVSLSLAERKTCW